MSAFSASFLAVLVLLALAGGVAFALAWLGSRLVVLRAERAASAGPQRPSPRAQRPWGGKDYARVRTKYFDKERHARAARARHQQRARAAAGAHERASAPPTRPASPERRHRETLGLVGAELTPETVRAAFLQRLREYHPDRVATLGVKLRRLAEEETKRINAAYGFFRDRMSE